MRTAIIIHSEPDKAGKQMFEALWYGNRGFRGQFFRSVLAEFFEGQDYKVFKYEDEAVAWLDEERTLVK